MEKTVNYIWRLAALGVYATALIGGLTACNMTDNGNGTYTWTYTVTPNA